LANDQGEKRIMGVGDNLECLWRQGEGTLQWIPAAGIVSWSVQGRKGEGIPFSARGEWVQKNAGGVGGSKNEWWIEIAREFNFARVTI